MYKIIGSPLTRGFRVIWCMEELGLEYELISAKPHSPEILELNLSGKVPALVVGDDVIFDSTAICQFLADKHAKGEQGDLTHKAGTIARAHQDSWTQFALDEVDGPLWTAAKHTFSYPEELRCKDAKPAAKFEFDRAIKSLETRLGEKPFVTGDTFTLPDLILCHCANWAEFGTKWPIPDGNAKDYFNRIRQRPAYKKTMQKRKS